jgi:replicative DNA helicase
MAANPQLVVARPVSREPRRDHRLEEQALGEAMLSDDALATLESILSMEDFDAHGHADIFGAMCAVSASGRPVDTVTVAAELEATGKLERIGGRAKLAAITAAASTAKNIEEHARMLADLAGTRRLFFAARRIADVACDWSLPLNTAVDKSMTALFAAADMKSGGPVSIRDIIFEAANASVTRTEEAAAPKKRGESTGFKSLDRVIAGRGFVGGRLYVIGAPPGTGKSAFISNVMIHSARNGCPSLLYSLEMKSRDIGDRLLCMEARVSSERYEAGELSGDDYEALTAAIGRLEGLPIHIDDGKEQTITQIRAKAKRHKRRFGRDPKDGIPMLVVVDFLQLIEVSSAMDERQRVTDAVSGLTALACELDVPVIAIASMNRDHGKRSGKDKRPVASDLLGSSRIESDASLVAFLYRDELVNPDTTDDRGIAEFIIRKQRQGKWPVTVRLKFNAECMRFEDLEEQRPDVPSGYDMDALREWEGR